MSKKISRRSFLKVTALTSAAFGFGFHDSRKLGIGVNQPFDTIIKNGVIYTGDGKAPIKGDIAIKNGKIAAIGNLGSSADQIIDAKGDAVSPGFIDIHTHTDTKLLQCPRGDSRIFQGVTTDVGGNCGYSPFPFSDAYFAKKRGTLREGYPFWQDIDGFYDALRKNKIGINYGSLSGQGDIRSSVVGDNNVPATKKQMEKMKSVLEREMEMGSLGLSCGLEYAPGSYASDDEIVELCKVVAKHDGFFAIHMRNEDDEVEKAVSEAIKIAKKSGVRLQISHLKAQNANNWHKGEALLKLIERGKSDGVNIGFDRYPYIAFSTGLTSFIPLNDRQGSNKEILARLKNDAKAEKIGEYAVSRINRLGGPQNVVLTSLKLPDNQTFNGRSVAECCEITKKEPWQFIRELLIEEQLGPDMIGFAMTENNVKLFLSHPLGMPASDGSVYSPEGVLGKGMPHPRSYGTFPRFLGKYCREEKIIDLATAIHKCTALPASRIGLKERGLLIPNYAADIVIFNPDTIIDRATFAEPHQFPDGIKYVIVNGEIAVKEGKHTGKLAGEIIS